MATFNPSDAKLRIAPMSAVAGIAPLQNNADWIDAVFSAESLRAERTLRPNTSIRGNSQQAVGNKSFIIPQGDITAANGAFHPVQHAQLLANIQRNSATPTTSGDAYIHKLAPVESDVAYGNLAFDKDRADDAPQLFLDMLVQQYALTVAANNWPSAVFSTMGLRYDYWDDPVQDAQTPTLTSLRVRGLPDATEWEDGTTVELAFQVDATVATTVKAVYSTGTPSFVGASTFTVALDTWTRVTLTDGTFAGTEDEPIEIYVPTGALSVADEFSFAFERTVWTPDAHTSPFDSVYAEITIDEEVYCIENFQLTVLDPVNIPPCIGGLFGETIRRRGTRLVTGNITRDYINRDLQKKLERKIPFAIRCQMTNGILIPSGGDNEQWTLLHYGPNAVFSGPTKVIGGPDDGAEALAFTCYEDPTESNGDTDDLSMWLTTDQATIP